MFNLHHVFHYYVHKAVNTAQRELGCDLGEGFLLEACALIWTSHNQ